MTATRLIRIDCDGPQCQVATEIVSAIFGDDTSVGRLGGGYVTVPHASIERVRQTIAEEYGWRYDRFRKRDLCPRCVDALRDTPPAWQSDQPTVPVGAGLGTA